MVQQDAKFILLDSCKPGKILGMATDLFSGFCSANSTVLLCVDDWPLSFVLSSAGPLKWPAPSYRLHFRQKKKAIFQFLEISIFTQRCLSCYS